MMKYPIGIQSFDQIREDGYVYVDKTGLICGLIVHANQALHAVMFHRSYPFVQELKANSSATENSARGIDV